MIRTVEHAGKNSGGESKQGTSSNRLPTRRPQGFAPKPIDRKERQNPWNDIPMLKSDPSVYTVLPAHLRPGLQEGWAGNTWRHVPAITIDCFRPESSDHRPRTRVRLVADDQALYGLFRVEDRFVRCIHREFQSPVYKDSCVEFFVQPRPDGGYFNFEFNCGGALLASYITDSRRTADGFAAFQPLAPEEGRRIRVHSSLPHVVEPEITDPLIWELAFAIPLEIMARYAGPVSVAAGEIWYGNFYKCGDETSRPHWVSWSPVERLNFHLPQCFGQLRFER